MSATFDMGDRMPLTENPSAAHLVVMRAALAALENLLAGCDGWGSELEVGAIDDLRRYLRLPKWCALCSWRDGYTGAPHTTYSHYYVAGEHWARCDGPCVGCDEYLAAQDGDERG